MKFKLLFLLLSLSFNIFSQSKKQQIIILTNDVDSLTNSNKKLHFEIDSMITFINHQAQDLRKVKINYDNIKQSKYIDSISYCKEKEKYLNQLIGLKDSINKESQNLSKWIKRNLNILLDDNIISSIKLNQDLTQSIKKTLFEEEYWLGANNQLLVKNAKFEDHNFYIRIDFGDENYSKTLLISNNFLILSYHLTWGSDGQAILINLKTMEDLLLQNYNVYSMITEDVLKISQDYYDNEGHVWEQGKYYIQSGTYEFLSKEH
jgi:hypothetical protein